MGGVRLVLFGAPGVGKGTLAEMIKSEYGVPHISTGDMLREAVKEGTELGRETSQYMNEGKLVPDDIMIGVLRDNMKDDEKGFILDGFPRTRKQAEALQSILDGKRISLDAVINFEAPVEVLTERLSGRRQCRDCRAIYHIKNMPPKKSGICDICGGALYQRDDDRREVVVVRLKVYEEETAELIDYYRRKDLLKSVDASNDPETTFREVKTALIGSLGVAGNSNSDG